jgi:hypothetical protein
METLNLGSMDGEVNLADFPEAVDDFGDLGLLDAVADPPDFLLPEAADLVGGKAFKPISILDFEALLSARLPREKPYGIYSKDVTMCRLSDSKRGESLLADIEQKNAEQGMGNAQIPNTNIRLINYSVCPVCGKIFSFKDLAEYYRHPETDTRFKSPGEQARNDTRVKCNDCKTWFLPALIIVDKTPINEVQFLCRNQTMNAVEKFFISKGKKVLTRNQINILTDPANGLKAVMNDVVLGDMAEKPTLITNMLQYTPANLALNLMDGSNIEKGDVLYGWWGRRL